MVRLIRRLWRWLFDDAGSWEEMDLSWLPPSDSDADGTQYGDLT